MPTTLPSTEDWATYRRRTLVDPVKRLDDHGWDWRDFTVEQRPPTNMRVWEEGLRAGYWVDKTDVIIECAVQATAGSFIDYLLEVS